MPKCSFLISFWTRLWSPRNSWWSAAIIMSVLSNLCSSSYLVRPRLQYRSLSTPVIWTQNSSITLYRSASGTIILASIQALKSMNLSLHWDGEISSIVNSDPPEGGGVLISWGIKEDDYGPLAVSIFMDVAIKILVILAYFSSLGVSTKPWHYGHHHLTVLGRIVRLSWLGTKVLCQDQLLRFKSFLEIVQEI